ncbi:MAG: YggS family pyridoxal phosphate-dependent enzyme [Planctomycetaceae bacterium]|nr:YggS family pyridoxal phosphate-dependent enzyme [Planctomycetaceae bacterium]
MPSSLSDQLIENARAVRQQIVDACRGAGRPTNEVKLVAVTKYVDTPTAVTLAESLRVVLGPDTTVILGENRPQVLQQRWEGWPADIPVEWHLIGQLQTNKIKTIIGRTALIHSLDRFDLLDKLQLQALKHDLTVCGLLEFRLSDDPEKHGFLASDIPELLDRWPSWSRLQFRGVMGMSGLESSTQLARQQFDSLREIHERIKRQLPPEHRQRWGELSMGMSGDLAPAIAAGATLVRIGSALFRGLLS